MKYAYPTFLGHLGSEYLWFCLSIFKRLEVVAFVFLSLQERGGRRPLKIKCIYSSSLGHVGSEYVRLMGPILKRLD